MNNSYSLLPLMAIFKIDCVLFPFELNFQNIELPCTKKDDKVIDNKQRVINCSTDIPAVFEKLNSSGIKIAIIHTCFWYEIDPIKDLLKFFDWDKYISYREITLKPTLDNLDWIQEISKIPLNKTIYFSSGRQWYFEEDKLRFRNMGLTDGKTDLIDGMTMSILDTTLKEYELKKQKSKKPQ